MNIDVINIKLSWASINRALKEIIEGTGVREAVIVFNGNVVLSSRFKGGMPFSLIIDHVHCDKERVLMHISEISLFIKVPGALKNALIKDYVLKGYIKENSGMYYDEQVNNLIIEKNLLKIFLPYEDFNINSLYVNEDGLELEVGNSIVSCKEKFLRDEGMNNPQCIEIPETEVNEDMEVEDFDIEKAEDYYSRIRTRIEKYIKSGVPLKYHYIIPYLLFLPDILMLFIRLFKDKRIKISDKAMIIAGIVYIMTPLDIIPDAVLPFGAVDDLGVAFFILDKLLISVPEQILQDNFQGNGDVINFIKNGYSYVKNIIPVVKMDKVLDMFNRILVKVRKK